MATFLSAEELVELVKSRINYETSQKDIAEEFGISRSYLSDFLQGKRGPGPAILKGLGFDERPYYKRAARRRS